MSAYTQLSGVTQVYFVGVGPGDFELLTIRGRELIEEADLLIHYGSATSPEIIGLAKKDVMSSYGKSLDEITETIAAYVKRERPWCVSIVEIQHSLAGCSNRREHSQNWG